MGKPEECYNGASFNPCLSHAEREDYYDANNIKHRQSNELSKVTSLATDVREAIEDLRWCNAIVFVFPTWWFNFPAALKGYFDRVITPGVGFLFPDSSDSSNNNSNSSTAAGGTGLIGCLTNITKIGVVTTSGASWAVTQYAGRGPRHFIARGFRTLCAPGCLVTWHQLYETASRTEQERRQFLQDVQTAYAQF
jgi:putative NADPH-quinone reductase